MRKSKTSVLKLWTNPWNKSKLKFKTIETPDSRRHSIKLITWNEKEDKDLNPRWRQLFHRSKKKRKCYKMSKRIQRPTIKNKRFSKKEFLKWWPTWSQRLKKSLKRLSKSMIKKWVNLDNGSATITKKR